MKFETGQTSEPTSANISIVSRSSKRGFVCTAYPTKLRRRTRTTCHVYICEQEINMASEMENVNEELIPGIKSNLRYKESGL